MKEQIIIIIDVEKFDDARFVAREVEHRLSMGKPFNTSVYNATPQGDYAIYSFEVEEFIPTKEILKSGLWDLI